MTVKDTGKFYEVEIGGKKYQFTKELPDNLNEEEYLKDIENEAKLLSKNPN